MSDPWPVSVSVGIYRGLLRFYPQKFRLEYSEAMSQVFRDMCLQDSKSGLVGVWGSTLLDYAVSLVSEYTERGAEMTKTKWIQLSGWGLAASGFVMMAGMEASSRPVYNPYNAAAWPVDPILNAMDIVFIAAAMLLMSAGLAGLLARFQNRSGTLGRAGLVLGGIAGLVGAAGAFGLGWYDSNPWWGMFMFGFLGVNLGLVLFGIACLRRRLFARWNGLPLGIGVFFLLFILASMGLIQIEWPSLWGFVLFFAFSLGLGMVGFRLQSEAVERPAATPG